MYITTVLQESWGYTLHLEKKEESYVSAVTFHAHTINKVQNLVRLMLNDSSHHANNKASIERFARENFPEGKLNYFLRKPTYIEIPIKTAMESFKKLDLTDDDFDTLDYLVTSIKISKNLTKHAIDVITPSQRDILVECVRVHGNALASLNLNKEIVEKLLSCASKYVVMNMTDKEFHRYKNLKHFLLVSLRQHFPGILNLLPNKKFLESLLKLGEIYSYNYGLREIFLSAGEMAPSKEIVQSIVVETIETLINEDKLAYVKAVSEETIHMAKEKAANRAESKIRRGSCPFF